jgi:two-component system, NarL family, nitrate/nitrite response regulator NarL
MGQPAKKYDDEDDRPSLSEREKQVLQLLCSGLRNKAIARQLGVAEGTVKVHVHHIYQKLGIRNRRELRTQILRRQRTLPISNVE